MNSAESVNPNNKKKKSKQQKNNIKNKKPKISQEVKNMNGLLEVKRLSVEEDVVTGYYEDCAHKKFNRNISFYPCPWDSRVLNDSDESVTCGCYYSCTKFDAKIIANKDVYVKAIDRLIANLNENPKWGDSFSPRKGIMNAEEKKQIDLWVKKKDEEDRRKYEEQEKYRKENEFTMIGCPPEFIKDLKTLNNEGLLNLGENFTFFDDKIIYEHYDWMYGVEEVEINTENIWFSMYPNQERTAMIFEIGTGCVISYNLELNSKNKEKLLNFWSKWKKFKNDNHELYNKPKERTISDEDRAKWLSDLECEVCLFNEHCNRLYCLK